MYNIRKEYEGKPSKNHIEEKGLTLEDAKFQLDINENLWRKNGGLVEQRTETTLIVSEADDSERITWTIFED